MSTPTEQIAEQDDEYRKTLLCDMQKNNDTIEGLMDDTIEHYKEEEADARYKAMDAMTRKQRGRLMTGESLKSILDLKESSVSKYYNTSDEAASAILMKDRFEYQIGKHMLMFEMKDLVLDNDAMTIGIPIVVWDSEEWIEKKYNIIDEDLWDIVNSELNPDVLILVEDFDKEIFNGKEGMLDVGKEGMLDVGKEGMLDVGKEGMLDGDDANCTIKRVQNILFNSVLGIFAGESVYSHQVYTPEMELRIKKLLGDGFFPFQIVNNIIAELVQ